MAERRKTPHVELTKQEMYDTLVNAFPTQFSGLGGIEVRFINIITAPNDTSKWRFIFPEETGA